MRKILFRAKYEDKWVYGDLLQDGKGFYEIFEQLPTAKHYSVDGDTVGQYTGLHDKHGKRIFEGDVITENSPSGNGTIFIGYVEYNEKLTCFDFVMKNRTLHTLGSYSNSYIVVGNVYDNSELIGG